MKVKLHIIIVLIVLFLPAQLFTKNNATVKNKYNTADNLLSKSLFTEAYPILKELLEIDPDNENYNFKIGFAIIEGKLNEDPLPYLEKASKYVSKRYVSNYKQKSAPIITLEYLAKEYHALYRFNEAKDAYNSFLSYLDPNDLIAINRTKRNIEYCNSGAELIKHPVKVEHLDFGTQLPIEYPSHSPVLGPDESIYIFASSNYLGNPQSKVKKNDDVYCMYFENGKWTKPEPLTNINTNSDEAPVSISPDGSQLIIYRNDNGVDGNLYYCDLLEGKVWSKPRKFPNTINSSAQETHATLSSNGNILYFTSDRKGGFGGLDIYMSQKDEKGNWQEAVNMGSGINSPYNDESPHLQANSDIFYFSSDRPESLGGMDVFRCRIVNNSEASDVRNIGYPINTAGNDMFFKTSLDGEKGFFTTSCRSSRGNLNLQVVVFKDIDLFPNVVVKGLVVYAPHDTLKNLNVKLFNIKSREIVDSGTTENKKGYYSFRLNSQQKYFASFEYDGYVYFSKPFKIEKYFANLAYSNVIYLDPVILTDSSFRQQLTDFKIYNQNLKNRAISKAAIDSSKKVSTNDLEDPPSSYYDIITLVEQQESANISRLNNKLATTKKAIKPQIIKKEEPVFIPEIIPLVVKNDTLKPKFVYKKVIIRVSQDDRTIADSLMRVGIKHFNREEFEFSIEKLQKAQMLYEKIGDIQQQIKCLNYTAEAMLKMGRYEESITIHRQALTLIQSINKKDWEGDKYERLGDIFATLNDKNNALENYYKALKIRRDLSDKHGEVIILNKIASLNFDQKDFDMAISYLQKSIEMNEKNEKTLAELYNRIGLAYQGKQDFDMAISYFSKAVDIASKYNDKMNKSVYLNNKGNAYYDDENMSDALDFYNQSLAIKREINYSEGIAITLHNIGNVYYKRENLKTAQSYYTQSNEIADKIDLTEIIIENHFGLMKVYRDQKKFDMALVHLKKYIELKDPYLAGMRLQITQQTNKYGLDENAISLLKKRIKRQELIALLETEKRLKEIQLLEHQQKIQKLIRYSLFAASVGMFVILILLFGKNRSKRKHLKLLEIKNQEIMQKNDEIITQKANLEQINSELTKLSIVASEIVNAVAILDNKGNYEWINKGYINLYGYTLEELNLHEDKNIQNYIADQHVSEKINLVFEHQSVANFDVQKQTKQGLLTWVKISLTPIVYDGSIYKIIAIEFDINDIKLAEVEILRQKSEIESQRDEIEYKRDIALSQKDEIEEKKNKLEDTIKELQFTQKKLVESEKMASLGNLVAGISHEINTPIGIGIAAITTLKTKVTTIDSLFVEKKMKQSDLITFISTAKDAAKLIQTHLNRTGELVKSFKRISVDEMTEQVRTFDLEQYLKDIVKSLEPKINEKQVEVNIECKSPIEMTSFPGAFAQILTNLIVNSMIHGFKDRSEGVITITCRQFGDDLKLVYQDNGKGMTPDVVEKVFNPFFTTNMQGGNGLGMNIVYNIVNQKLQGEISCESEINKGATFTVVCPVSLNEERKSHLRVVS